MLNTFVNPHRWAMYWTSYIFCWWRLVGFWKNVWNCGTHPIWWWGLQPFGSHSFVSHVNFHSHSLSISLIECLLLRCSWSHLFWHHLFFLLWDSFSAVAALPFVIWSKVAAMCAIAISAINLIHCSTGWDPFSLRALWKDAGSLLRGWSWSRRKFLWIRYSTIRLSHVLVESLNIYCSPDW